MKVILSTDAVRFPLTGIGRYTYELARHLKNAENGLDLRLMVGSRFVAALPDESRSTDRDYAPRRTIALRRVLQNSRLVTSAHRAWLSARQARTLLGHEDGIFHGPQFYLPRFGGRSVVTIHDLSVFTWAHCHPPGRAQMMRAAIERSIARAQVVITDSEFTRQEVMNFFALPADKVRAIALASSKYFAPRTATDLQPVLAKFGLSPSAYSLYSGTIEPRKNLDTLLDAYAKLPLATRQHWPLVLCGYQGWQSGQLHDRIRTAEQQGWAHYLGYVAGADLPYLFAGARLFVFPSLYEGFGLPVLEAMASGVPVVCSDSSSLPEVAGDAALKCAATDTDQLGQLIAQGLEDVAWREVATARGLRRAAQHSWARCAAQTVDAYRAASN